MRTPRIREYVDVNVETCPTRYLLKWPLLIPGSDFVTDFGIRFIPSQHARQGPGYIRNVLAIANANTFLLCTFSFHCPSIGSLGPHKSWPQIFDTPVAT